MSDETEVKFLEGGFSVVEKKQYGWSKYGEVGQGPFESEEYTIARAKEYFQGYLNWDGSETEIEVGECKFAKPEDCINFHFQELLERMDEMAFDDFSWCEDPIFEIDDEKQAQEELTQLLKAWAKKHITSQVWTLENTQLVKISDKVG